MQGIKEKVKDMNITIEETVTKSVTIQFLT